MFSIVSKRKIFFSISAVVCLAAILCLIICPLKLGIDFTGGAMIELSFEERPSIEQIKEKLNSFNLGEVKISQTGENGYLLRFKEIDEQTHQEILKVLTGAKEERYEIVGPTIGQEVKTKAKTAIILSVILIFVYIVWAFRKISRFFGRQESWRYGAGAILALVHDMLIMCGFFALLGFLKGTEVDTLFISALLTILGYSVNDTIVIYDRIRENTLLYGRDNFEEVVNLSLNESLVRSLNTSLTTLLVVLTIALFTGSSTQIFALALAVGIISGTWSTIAIATPFVLLGHTKKGTVPKSRPSQTRINIGF
ncbi:MAG: preprotein translocase subunit SecF [Parcubacteria group bacterium ADurb.Bin159]|nr:MAG: preprotein translocase subunit SecF [Parcubacteria group bacterium ADurb.Bin159]